MFFDTDSRVMFERIMEFLIGILRKPPTPSEPWWGESNPLAYRYLL